MTRFPAAFFREKFKPHFKDTDLADLFNDMCDLIEGTFDPWEKINQLKLNFYEFDEDEFEFDDWLINAGQFILIIKAHFIMHNNIDHSEIERLSRRFQEILDGLKPDFLEDELHYYFSFSFLNEFTSIFTIKQVDDDLANVVKEFMDAKFQELNETTSEVKQKALPLIVPHLLDALKLHPGVLGFLLGKLDTIIDDIAGDEPQSDETIGLCVRTLAFKDYGEASPPDQFAWARRMVDRINDPFIKLTSTIHVAIGHSLRNEMDATEELLSAALSTCEALPTPKKEVSIAFLMRGCIEAGIKSDLLDAISDTFKEITDTMVEGIHALNRELNTREDLDDHKVEELLDKLEMDFIIFSSILDNLALTGLHAGELKLLERVETLMERVNETNIAINFKSKLAVYYQKIGTEGKEKALKLVNEIAATLDNDVEHLYIEDLYDFFLDFSKDCMELALATNDVEFIKPIESVFTIIKQRKNLAEDDLATLQYQVLSAVDSLLSAMWNSSFNLNLLQGSGD
nr:hypothetical protein [Candidatus Sigynarchaeota archaeon]